MTALLKEIGKSFFVKEHLYDFESDTLLLNIFVEDFNSSFHTVKRYS